MGAQYRRRTHTEAAKEPEDHEDGVVFGQRGAERAQHIEGADQEQHLLAAEHVRELARAEGTDNRSDQGDRHREAEAACGEVEHLLQRFGGAGDDRSVESEDQSAERGDNCASNHKWIHAH